METGKREGVSSREEVDMRYLSTILGHDDGFLVELERTCLEQAISTGRLLYLDRVVG